MGNPYAKYLAPETTPRLVIPASPKEATPANDTTIANSNSEIANRKMSQTATMRDDFEKRPAVRAYRESLPMYAQALQSDETPAGDLFLTTAYAKLTDPSTWTLFSASPCLTPPRPALRR